TLTSSGSLFTTNTVTAGGGGAGTGAGAAGTAGSAFGKDLFFSSGGAGTFNVSSGTVTLAHPVPSNQTNAGRPTQAGARALDFSTNNLANTYTGTTTISDGSLSIASDGNLGLAANALALSTGMSVSPTLTIAGSVSTSRSTTLSGSNTGTFTINSGASLTHS